MPASGALDTYFQAKMEPPLLGVHPSFPPPHQVVHIDPEAAQNVINERLSTIISTQSAQDDAAASNPIYRFSSMWSPPPQMDPPDFPAPYASNNSSSC